MQRFIMHLDMDAFFASVEQLDNPELRGKPVLVGGGERGVVAAASYEARAFGVRSAMPMWQAKQRCPQAIVVRGNRARYAELSKVVLAVLGNFSPRVEQASIDEAYVDVTGLERLFGPVETLAGTVQKAVYEGTGGLGASIGIAPIKFVAKIASDVRKPGGITIIYPQNLLAFVHALPVGRIPGVGKSFQAALDRLGIHHVGQVPRMSMDFWEQRFGKAGKHLWNCANAIDPREVEPVQMPKSESSETTLDKDTTNRQELVDWLFRHAERVGRSLRKHGLQGRVVSLKIRFADFSQRTRQCTLPLPTCATQTIFEEGCRLLEALNPTQPVRLIGLGVSGFDAHSTQMFLLDANPVAHEAKRTKLDRTMDQLQSRYGRKALISGRLFQPQEDE